MDTSSVCSSKKINSARKEVDEYGTNKWSDILPEILELISDRLPLLDFIKFRCVCRHWRSAPSGRSEITRFPKDKPWLIFYGEHKKGSSTENKSGMCYLYSHSHPNCCALYLPDLKGATIMESKFGWLAARRDEHFFLFNCFTLQRINLPRHTVALDQACTFTILPTHSDCTVFIVSRICDSALELSSCRVGDDKWQVEKIGDRMRIYGTMSSVHCCSCSYDNSHCTCHLKNNKIGIYGAKTYVACNYLTRNITEISTRIFGDGDGDDVFSILYKELRARHGIDWLRGYGDEGGILISACQKSIRTGELIGLSRRQRIHGVAGSDKSTTDELNIVNAAWITPKFT